MLIIELSVSLPAKKAQTIRLAYHHQYASGYFCMALCKRESDWRHPGVRYPVLTTQCRSGCVLARARLNESQTYTPQKSTQCASKPPIYQTTSGSTSRHQIQVNTRTLQDDTMFAHTYEPARRGIPSTSSAVLFNSNVGPNTKV